MPEGSQDHAEIVSGAAQHGVHGITEGALEPIPTQFAFVFHMADRWLNGAAPMNGFLDRRGNAALLAAAPDRHAIDADAAIALVDEHRLRFSCSKQAHLLDGFGQRVTVVGMARQAAHTDHQTFLVRGGDGDLNAEFVWLACLAFGNALNLRGMQAVELVLVLGFLLEQSFDTRQNAGRRRALHFVLSIQFVLLRVEN